MAPLSTNFSLVATPKTFRLPPAAYRGCAFWHLNGRLNSAEIRAQLEATRDVGGFGGVAILPVRRKEIWSDRTRMSEGTSPEYLSEAYFKFIGEMLDTAKELGLEVVFYDDIDFPSGSAGELLESRHPEALMKELNCAEQTVEGPAEYRAELAAGVLMGAVAMHAETLERVDISAHAAEGVLRWDVPAGRWKIMVFTCAASGKKLVDFLSPEAVDAFIALTYEEYYRRFPKHFGSTIVRNFFDDVGFYAQPRAWTGEFNAKFEKKFGVSPVRLYPALWHDIGPETAAARVALWGFRAELLAEGYPRRVGAWCRAHGLLNSGHPPGNYGPTSVDMSGDIFKFYRHVDIPVMDAIFYHGHGRAGFKLISSAAAMYDRPLVAAEEFGAYKEDAFDTAMMYRTGMELFARGVNRVLPHGMWYDPALVRIPPLVSHLSEKIRGDLPAYNAWVGRSCLMLQGGRAVVDIAVLYPIAALEAWFYLAAPENKKFGTFVPPESDYQRVSDLLTTVVRRDFTFVHPEMLEKKCRVEGATLRLENEANWQTYQVLIMPGGKVIGWGALQKIKIFYDHGGKIIATSQLPMQSAEWGHDGDVRATVEAIFGVAPQDDFAAAAHGSGGVGADDGAFFPYRANVNHRGGKAYFAPRPTGATLRAILDDALAAPDVVFEGDPAVASGEGCLSYLHKIKDGQDIFYFANSSAEAVDVRVRLRGTFDLAAWDPHSGAIAAAPEQARSPANSPTTTVRLKLGAVRSVFLVGTPPPYKPAGKAMGI